MKRHCGCGFVRWMLACLLSASSALPADTGQYVEKQDGLVMNCDAGTFWATVSTSTDPIACRIKKTNKTFSPYSPRPEGLSSPGNRCSQHLNPDYS